MKTTFAGILTTACVLAGPIAAGAQQPANPWPGTRHLVVSKSTFRPGPAPKNRTFVIEMIEGGIKATVSGDEANGTKLNFEYTATFDGKDYPVTGNSGVDATSFRRIDVRTLESLRKKSGTLISTMRFVVSSDGKVVTLTETMADKKPGDVLVFER